MTLFLDVSELKVNRPILMEILGYLQVMCNNGVLNEERQIPITKYPTQFQKPSDI